MPADKDSLEYSVMSYHSYVGSPLSGYTVANGSYPTTLMMYDIAGLQAMYGANYNTNAGNTVYTWSPTTGEMSIDGVGQGAPVANKVFMTIWDGGGNDTYDFSSYTGGVTVDLQPGNWTVTSAAQLASLGSGHYAVGNIANALLYQDNPASLIENAIGSSGNDTITGNAANNKLTGGASNDTLDGLTGTDTAVYSGTFANYQLVDNGNGTWTVTDLRSGSPDGVDTLSHIELLQFSDVVVTVGGQPPPVVGAPTFLSFSTDSGAAGDGITSDNTPTLTGTAPAESTVTIFDGATQIGTATADSTGAWSFATTALADGAHSFSAIATDAQGNASSSSSVLPVVVDTAAPTAPTIEGYSPDSSTVGDGVTNANALTLHGDAEAGSLVHVYDGAMLLGTTVADANGNWTFATYSGGDQANFMCMCPACVAARAAEQENGGGVTGALTDGVHAFKVVAVDAAGNVSAASTVVNVTIDTVSPNAPVISSFSNDSGVVGDGVTNDNTPMLSGTAEANSTVKIFDGATQIGTATVNGSGAWTFTTAALTNGAHSLTATATDAAGNTGVASTALNVAIDTVAPVAPVIASFSDDSGVVGDRITNDNTLTLTGTAEANSTVKIFDGATLIGTATANGSGAWTFTTAALSNGSHSLTATATDAAGNTGVASATLNVTIDTVAPNAPVISSFSNDSGTVGDGITNDNTLTLAGTAEANSTVKIFDGATQIGTATANGGGAWSYTTAALTDGLHSLTATATDVAGNTGGASTALNVTIDATAPGAPAIASYSTDSGTIGDGITNDNTLTLTGTAGANSTVKLFDGATQIGTATANGSGAWTFTTAVLSEGGHSLTATATDAAGNNGAASSALVVTIDTTAPVAPVITSFSDDSGTAGDSITNDNTLTLAGTAEANSTVKIFDGATQIGTATANGSGGWTYTTAALTDGPHSLTATATDGAGNTGGTSTALNVTIDTAPPGDTAPVANNDSYGTAAGTTLAVPASEPNNVLMNDTDADGDPLTAILVTRPTGGTLDLNDDGSFIFTPTAGFAGTTSFSYKANDGTLDSNVATVSITVAPPPNTAPIAVSDAYTTSKNTKLTVTKANGVLANDSDIDGDALKAILVSQPKNGKLSLNADGSFSFTPNRNFTGTTSFTYKDSDGTATSNIVTATITVGNVISTKKFPFKGRAHGNLPEIFDDQILPPIADGHTTDGRSKGFPGLEHFSLGHLSLLGLIGGEDWLPNEVGLFDHHQDGTGLPDFLHAFYSEFTLSA
jgi:hypothetical protein